MEEKEEESDEEDRGGDRGGDPAPLLKSESVSRMLDFSKQHVVYHLMRSIVVEIEDDRS